MLRNKKAQSTLEYVIILTAIVGAILWAATGIIANKNKTTAVGKMMDDSASAINTASGKLKTELK